MSKITQAGTLAPELLAGIQVYINTKRYRECDAGKILDETGGDFLIGGPIYLKDKRGLPTGPCCHLKADGEVLCAPDYMALLRLGSGGIAWDSPADWRMEDLPAGNAKNYIQCVSLIIHGVPVDKPDYQPDMAYRCPRQAIGRKQGRVAWYASKDKLTPEELRDRLVFYGWDEAIMLDGGGSTVFYSRNGGSWYCDRNRVLYSYIVFTLAQKHNPEVETNNDRKRRKVLETAAGEIGTVESPGGSNRTPYGAWYGLDGYAWCMMFVQWVFAKAGLPLPVRTASCTELANWARKHGQWVTKNYKPGDILFMHWGKNKAVTEHVGVVKEIKKAKSSYVVTYEGNTSIASQANGGCVMERNRAYANITGAYRPWYNL